MTNYELINKIRTLKQIKPDKEWKESTRAFLLFKIRGDERIEADRAENMEGRTSKIGLIGLIGQIGRMSRIRPAMAAVLVIIFTITGCAYGLNISKTSLPGDVLWNVKLSLEKAQVTFSSVEQKVKLETEFAGKRLEELKIVSSKEKPKTIAQAVENFKIHINEAKEGIKELEKEEPEKVSEETYAAITNAEDGYKLWEEELIERIEQRIKNARELASSLDKDFAQAEALLEEGRLIEALEKILEIEKIIKVK